MLCKRRPAFRVIASTNWWPIDLQYSTTGMPACPPDEDYVLVRCDLSRAASPPVLVGLGQEGGRSARCRMAENRKATWISVTATSAFAACSCRR